MLLLLFFQKIINLFIFVIFPKDKKKSDKPSNFKLVPIKDKISVSLILNMNQIKK